MDICLQPFQGGTEAAARNARAIRLYRRLGYGCLNTITLRKDFRPEEQEVIRREQLYGLPFDIKRYRETESLSNPQGGG